MNQQIIGLRFKIGRLIGQGGMGDVYEGLDLHTEQPVAIKHMKREIIAESPELVERFTREGEALRKLNHPNIVKVLASITENDQHYLVMEYVGGGSLRELLEDTPLLPIDRVLNIALDLSDALTRAHRLHIIHRDIKPANVLLAEDGTPRLSDFGVAYMGDRTRVTESGALIGTYAYISPEGCMSEELDVRADIWSFGVMLYEMVAGRRPFEGAQPAAVLTAILQKPVPDLLQFRPDAPAPLVGLIYSMLEKDREKRISSVRLVGAQLEAFIKGSDTAIERMSNLFHGGEEALVTTPPPIVPAPITPSTPSDDDDAVTVTPAQSPVLSTPTPTVESTRTIRKVQGAPRIFISYRREDSIAVTGRIYDRLALAFGEDFVFKDVDNIPVGANFKAILENEVQSCDVLLAVIGQSWLDIRDRNGNRRLSDPNDFVRIEIAAALQRQPQTLVVPVLVNNTNMPAIEHLPHNLHDLAYRNAAMVRNDPDFNRDVIRLVEEIRETFEITPVSAASPRRMSPLLALAMVAVLVGVVAVLLSNSGIFGGAQSPEITESPAATSTTATDLPPTPLPETAGIAVAPVAEGEYMVLVAELEPINERRDITRFIVRDLQRKLEQEIPFSETRIRQYAGVIRSKAEAQAVADETGATVIVWGNYTSSAIELEIQLGSLAAFPDMSIDRDTLERSGNITVKLNDPLNESIVNHVLGVLTLLQIGDGDAYEAMRTMAIINQLNEPELESEGSGTSTYLHHFLRTYADDTDEALEAINAAVSLDPGNPIVYISGALVQQRLGNVDDAIQDIRSAERREPDWVMPDYLRSMVEILNHDWDGAIAAYDAVIALKPDDWFPYNMRGWYYYLKEDYPQAIADYDKSIALNPNSNFPYIVSALIALRQGRLDDARRYFDTVLREYPDPTFANRLISTTFGERDDEVIGPMFSAVGHFILEQYDQMLVDTQRALAVMPDSVDLLAMEGFAYCNLEDYAKAEEAYTKAIDLEPEMPFVYLLRGDIRLKTLNLLGANADATRARELVEQGKADAQLLVYLDAGLRREVNCQNFFEWVPPQD